ncbi:hypothetical protein SBA3_3050001 [Candidatus Sulfopaludibacter sp. SbA3]|nr:hypothetical protein SBA3_3050001 [Candidatus Sulfopaludibacter sp. SbA3]
MAGKNVPGASPHIASETGASTAFAAAEHLDQKRLSEPAQEAGGKTGGTILEQNVSGGQPVQLALERSKMSKRACGASFGDRTHAREDASALSKAAVPFCGDCYALCLESKQTTSAAAVLCTALDTTRFGFAGRRQTTQNDRLSYETNSILSGFHAHTFFSK